MKERLTTLTGELMKEDLINKTGSSETEESVNKRRIPKKSFIITFAIILAALIAAIFKDAVLTDDALRKIRRSDFAAAKSISSYIGKTKGDSLRKYIDLRLEINREYPRLLAEFNAEKFKSWRESALEIKDGSEKNSARLYIEASKLCEKLDTVCRLIEEYDSMRPEILDMMDVFEEINRLYDKDSDGNSTVFTISEEMSKVSVWEEQCNSLSKFSAEVPDGDSIYLLSFLITETRSECSDIRKQMDELRIKGYGDNDPVRVSASGHKSFPDIANGSGTAVSVSRKEEYEEFMFISVCRAFTESLAEYYTGF